MSITLKATSTASLDGGLNFTVTTPSGITPGDFLIAHISYRQGAELSGITPPSGWTLLRSDSTLPDSAGISSWLYTRVVDGTESSSYTFVLADFRQAAGGIVAYSGVKTADPIDSIDATVVTSTTTPTSPTASTVYTQPWLLWFLAARDNAASDTADTPVSMTQRWRVNPSTGLGCVALLSDEVFSGPGNVPAKSGALSPSAQAITTLIVLSPADENPNYPPMASAGPDKATEINVGVILDGSDSSDRNPSDILTYDWTHISGPNGVAQLSDPSSATPTYTPLLAGIDVFRLTVTDQSNASSSDDVAVSTTPVGVNLSFASGTGSTVTVPLPDGASIGDIAYLAIAIRPLANLPFTANWHAIQAAIQGGSSTDISLFTFARRLTAGDLGGSVTATFDDAFGSDWTAHVVTVRSLHGPELYNKVLPTIPLVSPHSFSNSVVGGGGSTTYTYTVTAIDEAGETVATQTQEVPGAPATLTSSNYVQLVWQPSSRALSYNVYGRTAGSQQLIANVVIPQNVVVDEFFYIFHDTGTALGPEVPPTQQPTDWLMDGLNLEGDGTTLMPERLFTTYPGGRLLVFAAGQLLAPNASFSISDPSGMSVLTTTLGPNDKVVLHSAMQILGAAGNAGTRLFTPNDYTPAWATTGIVLRPVGANGAPTASAGFDQDAEVGTTVYLDGSQSYDEDGDGLSYAWTQTAGPTVTLNDANTVFPTFTMPKTSVTFQLRVTDPGSAQSTDSVTITPIQAGQVKVQNSSSTWTPL
jgi:hypothetical protein